MSLKAGDLLDRYKLVAPVGEGGQGSVWKALDERGDRLVALKLHRLSRDELAGGTRLPSQESEETHRERLRREAQALRQLDHPSLVRCLGMFEDYERDVLGLVLEWIEGSTLTVAARTADMTETHRMWVLGHLVRALAHLHLSGMVHRDLKFSNVLVSPMFWQYPSEPATIKLVDLGVAAPVGNPDPLTRAGGVVGTVAYLAPERIVPINGALSGATTASDVFAFGVLGWRLLTGKHPTGLALGASVLRFLSIYELTLQGGQPWPTQGQVDGPWGEVLLRCLPLRPEERLDSAVSIVDLIDGRQQRPSVPARLPGAHVTAPLRQYEGTPPAGAAPADASRSSFPPSGFAPGASPLDGVPASGFPPSAPHLPTAPELPISAQPSYQGPSDQLPTMALPARPAPEHPTIVQPARQPSPRAASAAHGNHATFVQPVRPPSAEAWQAAPPTSFVPPSTPAPLIVPGPYHLPPGAMPFGAPPQPVDSGDTEHASGSTWKVIVGVLAALLVALLIGGGMTLMLH